MKLVNIGFGNLINADRVIAVISPDSAPAKRMIQESKERANLIDATHGRKTKGIIITDSDAYEYGHSTVTKKSSSQ